MNALAVPLGQILLLLTSCPSHAVAAIVAFRNVALSWHSFASWRP